MANEENLIPFNERTESEQRQIAQKGGIASGAARRRKRSMKEAADYYLSLPETDLRRVNALLRGAAEDAGRGDRAGGPGSGCTGSCPQAAGRCGQCH